ncbi:archaeal proteasome endopeptidase complex subunit beta [Candidatus Bathyarchaeota archaeon]|nr:archaeal proteasome endopeptidase complex subunit beta [Candidatus Bathyarchaeota archaeon]
MRQNVDPKMIENTMLKGTTTVGMVCKDGVVLATDTRVTAGGYVAHRQGKKVYQIDKHLGMTIAGVVADAQDIVEVLKANTRIFQLEKDRPMPVSAATRLTANMLFQYRGALMVQALVGGVDDTGPHLFSIDPLGSVSEESCIATGSGSPVAYGVLESQFHEGLTVQEGIVVAAQAIFSAMKRNAYTGDSFAVVVIDESGYRELTEIEKESIEAAGIRIQQI